MLSWCLQVTVQVDKDSKEAKKAAEKSEAAASGLDAFLQQIESKKKVRARTDQFRKQGWLQQLSVQLFACWHAGFLLVCCNAVAGEKQGQYYNTSGPSANTPVHGGLHATVSIWTTLYGL